MIAISAELATDWPNVGPIDSTLELSAQPEACRRAPCSTLPTSCRRRASSVEIWTTCLPSSGLLTVWIFASPKPGRRERVAHLLDGRGLLERRGDARARLEVDAEVDALAGDRQRADQQDQAGHREEPLRRAHEVERAACACAWPGAERGCGSQDPRAAQRADDRLRREHRGEQRHDRADAQREREALDARRGEDEQDERDEERDDVGVDDRREALLVARGDGRRTRICRRAPPP